MFLKIFRQNPILALRAFWVFRKMKKNCAAFDGFANRNYIYSLGLKINKYENVSIGKRCSFGGNVALNAHDKITIGDDCLFAYGVVVNTAGHNYMAKTMNKTYCSKPVEIGSNVWIGACAIILPGVIISDNSVVGAGAVVTKDVPENAIVVGNPARIMKYRPVFK